jgi:hypothetical protein
MTMSTNAEVRHAEYHNQSGNVLVGNTFTLGSGSHIVIGSGSPLLLS